MNREEILDEINKTKQHLTNMEKMLKECDERWKPNSCDAYYYIDAFGNVLSQIETGIIVIMPFGKATTVLKLVSKPNKRLKRF